MHQLCFPLLLELTSHLVKVQVTKAEAGQKIIVDEWWNLNQWVGYLYYLEAFECREDGCRTVFI